MESRLRVAGHPVHPILVMFPLGLFSMAVIFDAANMLGGPELLGEAAYWNLAAGLFGGGLAAVAGLVDLLLINAATRARKIAVTHGLVNLGVLLLFAVILVMRMGAPDRSAGGGLFIIECFALVGAVVAAWFGGELVDRLTRPADEPANGCSPRVGDLVDQLGTPAFGADMAGHRT